MDFIKTFFYTLKNSLEHFIVPKKVSGNEKVLENGVILVVSSKSGFIRKFAPKSQVFFGKKALFQIFFM